MLQAISITIREGFEAALVIGIMLTYAVKTGRGDLKRPILWGTVAAIGVSLLAAFGLSAAGVDGRERCRRRRPVSRRLRLRLLDGRLDVESRRQHAGQGRERHRPCDLQVDGCRLGSRDRGLLHGGP